MDVNMDEQHGHVHEHAAWKRTCRMDIDMAKQYRHKLDMDKDMHHGQGHAPWTWSRTMYVHVHAKWTCAWTCTWTWTCIMEMDVGMNRDVHNSNIGPAYYAVFTRQFVIMITSTSQL